MFSQFIAAVIPSNSSSVQLVEKEPILEETNENKEQDSVNNSDRDNLNSSDSADSNGDDDGKQSCPVCNKRFQNVGVHLANKRDEVHMSYVCDKKNENHEITI